MDIKVLGFGCASCNRLYEDVTRAVKQLSLTATVSKVDRVDEMAAYKIMMTPALVVNGEVKAAGRIPGAAEMMNWLTTAAMKEAGE